MKYASALPFTEAERQRFETVRAKVTHKGVTRKQAAPLGDYSRKATPESRALDQRILGELSRDGDR